MDRLGFLTILGQFEIQIFTSLICLDHFGLINTSSVRIHLSFASVNQMEWFLEMIEYCV